MEGRADARARAGATCAIAWGLALFKYNIVN